ncbi:alpha/beta hydrolase family esterase [Mycolicibacterium sp. CBM1]
MPVTSTWRAGDPGRDRTLVRGAGRHTAVVIRRVTAFLVGLVLGGGVGAGPASASVDPPGVLTFGTLQRTYIVHVPPGPPNALVLNLHGAGQTGRDQQAVTGYDAVADQHGFVVAYPDGIDLSWADGRGASIPDRQGVDDVGFLAALIVRLSREFGIAPGRVFVTGMSAGAFMTTRLACARADLVGAIAPVAGTLSSTVPCSPSRPVSVLAVHGNADPVVPYNGGPMVGRGGPSDVVAAPVMAERWRAADTCPAPVPNAGPGITSLIAVGCAGGAEVAFVSVEGGGHIWPLGGFDASQASAQFFAARP